MTELETKQQVTRKFITGVVIMVLSLVLGKLVLIPIIFFPTREWKIAMLIVYLFSWVMMLGGIGLAGLEGYRLVTHKYKHYKRKTINHVKNGSKKAAHHMKKHSKKAARKVKKHSKKAAKKTKKAVKKKKKNVRRQTDSYKKQLLRSDKSYKEISHTNKFLGSKP